jgi:sialate O-acetylesterase
MKKNCLVLICLSLIYFGNSFAVVKLPAIFSSNMVLQQQSEVPFWGEATPNKKVRITSSWNKKTIETKADTKGNWKTTVSTPVYGGPFTIEISDGKKTILENVMVGEVWLCSGQSNMEMPLGGWGKIANSEQEINSANYPDIRLLQVSKTLSTKPLTDLEVTNGGWVACSPKTVEEFSSVAYFFGRDLYKMMKIPIGLINTSWGGTIAEAWTSGSSLKTMPDFKPAVDKMEQTAVDKTELKAKYNKDLIDWQNQVEKADKGFSNGKVLWAVKELDESDWKPMNIPDNWENQSLPGFDGVV